MEQPPPILDHGKLCEVVSGLRFPSVTLKRIDRIATREDRTRAQIIRALVAHALAAAEAGNVLFNTKGLAE